MNKKVILAVFAAIVLAAVLVGAVYAALQGKTETPVENSMSAETDPPLTVSETWNNTVKKDVSVNVGDPKYSVYVRADIVVTWKDKDGNVYSKLPQAGTDYTIRLNTVSGTPIAVEKWFFGADGFFYYTSPVVSGNTDVLINECKVKADTAQIPEGYQLSVEIIAQTVQYKGTTDRDANITAVEDAWHVTLSQDPVSADEGDPGVYIINGPVSVSSGTSSPFEAGPSDLG